MEKGHYKLLYGLGVDNQMVGVLDYKLFACRRHANLLATH